MNTERLDKNYALLFDLDGTLINPTIGTTHSIAYALEKMGRDRPDPETLTWCIGPSLRLSFATLMETDEKDLIEEAITHYRERFSIHGVTEYTPYDGMMDCLTALSSRYDLYLCTAKYEKYAKVIIENLGLTQHFKGVHGDDAGGRFTDKGDLMAHILKSHGLTVQNCLMMGDRMHDIKAAHDNGMESIHIGHGFAQPGEFDQFPPTYTARGFSNLTDIIDAHFGI